MAISETDLLRWAEALPLADGDRTEKPLREADVLRFIQILESTGSPLPQLVRDSVKGLGDEATIELPHTTEGYVMLSPDQLDAIVNRAALAGGAAIGEAIGENLATAQELEAMLATSAD